MNISELKRYGKLIEDNRKKAGENWAKSWGFEYWRFLWGYRTYEYGRFKYMSGRVNMRHYGYNHVECYIDGNAVTEYKFKKELAKEPIPQRVEPLSQYPKYYTRLAQNARSTQLNLDFN